ncbi:WbqC family protein [Maribacter polysiphoniae]|uniref:WbqC family protein n=1 Tax=Maribacter polysiphoniae TaxID=429344 RepID=UPI002356817B|nr:WbqC family protein [Maribacter polysiphoniae]
MKTILHPTYFPSIVTASIMAQNEVVWEVEDNYQKQTYRNRCNICTDRGLHSLSIPIKHVGGLQGRQKYKDVRLDNDYHWQRQHWRTLQTAYRTSPFFEYYEDELSVLFDKPHDFLLDFNFKAITIVSECLQIDHNKEKTSSYTTELPDDILDGRFLVQCKNEKEFEQEAYVQVFGDRHGFIKNVSVLDLLFNEGTNAKSYLNSFKLDFLNA